MATTPIPIPEPMRRDVARLLDNLYGLHFRPGHLDALLEVIQLHAPVKVPIGGLQGLITAKYLNPGCAEKGCQFLQREAGQPQRQPMVDAAEMLWVVLANVSGGDWTKQTAEWQEAAARWRDNYFAALKPLKEISDR